MRYMHIGCMHDLQACNPLSAAFITATGNKVRAHSWHVPVPEHVHMNMFASVHGCTLTCMQSVPGKACSKSSNSTVPAIRVIVTQAAVGEEK